MKEASPVLAGLFYFFGDNWKNQPAEKRKTRRRKMRNRELRLVTAFCECAQKNIQIRQWFSQDTAANAQHPIKDVPEKIEKCLEADKCEIYDCVFNRTWTNGKTTKGTRCI